MLTFLFWNLKNANPGVLASLVEQHGVDVLILAECPIPQGRVLRALNPHSADFSCVDSQCSKIQFYTRFSDEFALPVGQAEEEIKGDDFSVKRLCLSKRLEILLCWVHFPSKLRQTSDD